MYLAMVVATPVPEKTIVQQEGMIA